MTAARAVVGLAVLALCSLAVACSSGDDSGSTPDGRADADGGAGAAVRAVEGDGDPRMAWAFEPARITVVAGDEVEFINDGSEVHTATAGAGEFDTGTLSAGESTTISFNDPGTFAFHCTLHPWMTGEVTVEAS